MQLQQIKNKGQRRLGNDDAVGKTEYPSSSAGGQRFKRLKLLEELLEEEDRDTFYSCKQCGFQLDQNKVQSPGGTPDGNGQVTIVANDPVVGVGGCSFCGSMNSK